MGVWDSGQVSAVQAGAWCGALLEAGEQSLGVQGPVSKGTRDRVPVLCSIPGLCRAGGKGKFLPGVAFQVSSAGSWKSISTNALQGTRSDRQQYHLHQRQSEQQIMLLRTISNTLLVVKEKTI